MSGEEWAFVARYLALVREDAPQRVHDLREVFNALRWVVKTGTQWRYLPNHFAWLTRFHRLARDFERLPTTLGGLHCLAFACLLLARTVKLYGSA